jgi:hypothetical protein
MLLSDVCGCYHCPISQKERKGKKLKVVNELINEQINFIQTNLKDKTFKFQLTYMSTMSTI